MNIRRKDDGMLKSLYYYFYPLTHKQMREKLKTYLIGHLGIDQIKLEKCSGLKKDNIEDLPECRKLLISNDEILEYVYANRIINYFPLYWKMYYPNETELTSKLFDELHSQYDASLEALADVEAIDGM